MTRVTQLKGRYTVMLKLTN